MTDSCSSTNTIESALLRDVLRRVSRSFYLTLSVAPVQTRRTVGLGYLFCRTADTIADTSIIPPGERLNTLTRYREQFLQPTVQWPFINDLSTRLVPHQGTEGEQVLLSKLRDCFLLLSTLPPRDQELIRELVATLTNGMAMDLSAFPGDSQQTARALPTMKEMDQYCYYVAGCVGEFWTRLHRHYFPKMADSMTEEAQCQLAVHFGKGLQLTNLLKDIGQDLARGRCYVPQELLTPVGLTPQLLTGTSAPSALRPVLGQLLMVTLLHLDEGWRYIRQLPKRPVRLRLACLWPHLLALKTLRLIATADRLLEPTPVKISRSSVYRTMAASTSAVWSPPLLERYHARLRGGIVESLR
jgi:farnesyl-diphosphate farnesyltransferase